MPKSCRVKRRTKLARKRCSFFPVKKSLIYEEEVVVDSVNKESTQIVNILYNNDTVIDLSDENKNEASDNIVNIPSHSKIRQIDVVESSYNTLLSGYRIIDIEVLSVIFKELICPMCFNEDSLVLSDNLKDRHGLASFLVLKCSNCLFRKNFCTSKKSGKQGYDVNKRVVYTMRSLGHGHAGLEKFTSLMNIPPPMTRNNYDKLAKTISKVVKKVAIETMCDAAAEIRHDSNTDIVDTGVSCDGTWQRRGFSSYNGVMTAISIDSGKVLDVEPMSRVCKACILMDPKKKSEPLHFAEWRNVHKCAYDYKGSAGGMEPVGMKKIFERSITDRKLRYIKYLGDGDSKSYLNVMNVYPGLEVKKLECVGHYQKRIGTRLRNLKKKTKSLGGRGKLTDATIDRLQSYFGIAIRANVGDLASMKAGTLASLYHVASNKENNLHFPHCPVGADSWCKYNSDKANGTNTYKPGPGLPIDIVYKIKPIFAELSADDYLEKCLHGKTQNTNESFNGTIWERLPKTKFVSFSQLEFGVYDAVANFNIGRKASILVYESLDIIPGAYTLKGCKNLNYKRLSRSKYRNIAKNKLRRKIICGKKHNKNDKEKEKEGKLYEAGGF
jgi:hypothetical protein